MSSPARPLTDAVTMCFFARERALENASRRQRFGVAECITFLLKLFSNQTLVAWRFQPSFLFLCHAKESDKLVALIVLTFTRTRRMQNVSRRGRFGFLELHDLWKSCRSQQNQNVCWARASTGSKATCGQCTWNRQGAFSFLLGSNSHSRTCGHQYVLHLLNRRLLLLALVFKEARQKKQPKEFDSKLKAILI